MVFVLVFLVLNKGCKIALVLVGVGLIAGRDASYWCLEEKVEVRFAPFCA